MTERQRFFESVYRDNLWDSRESRSGQGSEVAYTAALIAELPPLFKQIGVTSIVDVPCGDFNWMRHVDLEGIKYVGADIVPEIVQANQARFGSDARRFVQADIIDGELPAADLVFCRDCMIHFSLPLIERALRNILSGPARYLMLTHDTSVERYAAANGANVAIDDAGNGVNYLYRPLNFTLAPFFFPSPLQVINEGQWDNCKTMALWRCDDLRKLQTGQPPG